MKVLRVDWVEDMMKRCLPLLALIAGTCLSFGQPSPREDFALAGPNAYGMLSPSPILTGSILQVKWSDDGKYVFALGIDYGKVAPLQAALASRQEAMANAEQVLVAYNVEERKAATLWRSKLIDSEMTQASWFKGTDRVVSVITDRLRTTDPQHPNPSRQRVVLFDAVTGASQVVMSVPQEESEPYVDLHLAPEKAIGFISVVWQVKSTTGAPPELHYQFRTLSSAGSLSNPVDIDSGAFFSGWLPDGVSPVLMTYGFGPDKKIWRKMQALELDSGKLMLVSKVQYYTDPTVKQVLDLQVGGGTATTENKSKDLRSVWLRGEDKEYQGLVSSDATEAQLSPTLSGVSYVSQGVAMIRPIIKLPKELFLAALKAADRMKTMNDAKQCGLALIMFASDNDDLLPSNQADVNRLMDPYLKNRDAMSGFVYTYGGGFLTDIKSPAETTIGYVPGVGGKAVIYSDGHVKWQPDQ